MAKRDNTTARDRRTARGAAARIGAVLATVIAASVPIDALQARTVWVENGLANHYAVDPLPAACGQPVVLNIPKGYRIERPHTIFNASTKTWVLWAHYEASGYGTAQALVATSATPCGPFTIVRTFRPLGREVRDEVLFQDDDGTGYFLAASNKNGGVNDTLAIFRLTPDYTDVDASAGTHWALENQGREAPVVAKQGSVYFLVTSQAAGWYPSQAEYVTGTSMLGEWSAPGALGDAATFGGQAADLRTYPGTSGTAHILVLDHLGGAVAKDDGALWLPLFLDGRRRTAKLDWYSRYGVNLDTGAVLLPHRADLAASAPATASSTAPDSSPANVDDGAYGTEWVAAQAKFPAWWMADLGAQRHLGEIDISWWMKKGSEAFYAYDIDYSSDGVHFSTIDRSNNSLYGFTVDKVDITARFVKIRLKDATLANNPHNWYTPRLWDVRMLP